MTLLTGPVTLPDPAGVTTVHVETAQQMLDAARHSLPADVAVFAAAVADWRSATVPGEKIKKSSERPAIDLLENADILATVAMLDAERPSLVIGFAAETQDVVVHAEKKLKTKGADWIAANDVSVEMRVFGGDSNTVHLVTPDGVENWPQMSKDEVAKQLMLRAAEHLRLNSAAAE